MRYSSGPHVPRPVDTSFVPCAFGDHPHVAFTFESPAALRARALKIGSPRRSPPPPPHFRSSPFISACQPGRGGSRGMHAHPSASGCGHIISSIDGHITLAATLSTSFPPLSQCALRHCPASHYLSRRFVFSSRRVPSQTRK
jgi:hypothetical protein